MEGGLGRDEDERTRGREDVKTRGREDVKTRGREDEKTRGREDERMRNLHRAEGIKKQCSVAAE